MLGTELHKAGGQVVKIKYSRMRVGQESEVVALIHAMTKEYGSNFITQITTEIFKQNYTTFLHIEVATLDNTVIGLCMWTFTFSVWRGLKGMYVADNFIAAPHWSIESSRKLLAFAASNAAAEGCAFVRMEVDLTEEHVLRSLAPLGFTSYPHQSPYYLETKHFTNLIDEYAYD